MRHVLLFLIASLCLTSSIDAADGRLLTTVRLEDLTPEGSPLKFRPQKIKWQYDRVFLWGTVTNTATDGYKHVAVSFTALGDDRQFLGRQKWFADPMDLDREDTGNIDGAIIETEGRLPAILQFKVMGSRR